MAVRGPCDDMGLAGAHSRLEAEGIVIIGTDGHPAYPAKLGENMAVALGGTDGERLISIFDDLAKGGKIKRPLASQPWGAFPPRRTVRDVVSSPIA